MEAIVEEMDSEKQVSINKKQLKDEVVDYLVGAVFKGEFKPGHRLAETKIARTLNISQGVVREAFQVLRTRGFLESIPFKGTFVRAFTDQGLKDYFRTRTEIEMIAVKWSSELPEDPDNTAYLMKCIELMENYRKEGDKSLASKADLDFHRAMLKVQTAHPFCPHGRLLITDSGFHTGSISKRTNIWLLTGRPNCTRVFSICSRVTLLRIFGSNWKNTSSTPIQPSGDKEIILFFSDEDSTKIDPTQEYREVLKMNAERELQVLLEKEAERSIKICQELVRIPSEDPPGDTADIAGYIFDLFKSEGIDCEIVSPHPEKPNVVARVKGGKKGPRVVFNGHMDTFRVGDLDRWSHDPFGGVLEGGRIYGRGASDMKGGLSASILSVILLNRMRDSLTGEIAITCVSDEEVFGPWGSQYLLKNHPDLRGDALINGEPSSLENIRIGEKGQYWFRFTCHAEGGHGAYAALKSSAINNMMKLLNDLGRLPESLNQVLITLKELWMRQRMSMTGSSAPVQQMQP